MRIDGQLRKLAVVLSDVTAEVENEQLGAERREMTAIVHRISEDRSGFLEFFQESEDTLEALRHRLERRLSDGQARRPHTQGKCRHLRLGTSRCGVPYDQGSYCGN